MRQANFVETPARISGRDVERESQLHCARVYLAEAKRRRSSGGFHAMLLQWAASCRKRMTQQPMQRELFE